MPRWVVGLWRGGRGLVGGRLLVVSVVEARCLLRPLLRWGLGLVILRGRGLCAGRSLDDEGDHRHRGDEAHHGQGDVEGRRTVALRADSRNLLPVMDFSINQQLKNQIPGQIWHANLDFGTILCG